MLQFVFNRIEIIVGKEKMLVNPLPHMPILGSSNSVANTDMMSKILTNWDTII